ncbi:MIF4G like-domain-containing protein [Aspergillus pseudonomiae]|uniref:MIF4G like-domain-containing protein n=1 Tax=Aspergillus pseudonomiae TaxID=1506151 RepID=A0A5N6HQ86_9EURO|nr:MIF4G like-domain-containing protein [Aspergillus pseudonomiae]KAB8256014.1 MIF4G like-domain-containing protein [Aspergillus pseudonomiae]KAE8399389.1 MIF4G like-domain-containing protein [Aspergillus pseudonomiae]
MVDYERRHHGPKGGRKRRYREDDDYDRRQRRRYEEPLVAKVRRQLLTIAESAARRAEDDVVTIAKSVADNYEDEELRQAFVDISVDLALEQPLKIPFIAATVLAANAYRSELVSDILTKASEYLQHYINNGAWREVKLLLRFLGCLQILYEGDGIFPILEELFERAVVLQTASSEDLLGLELVKIILFTIPYIMASPITGYEAQANALLEKTDIIASTPHALVDLVKPFSPEYDTSSTAQSVISLLQSQLQQEANRNWELACLPRPWKGGRDNEEEQKPLESGTKHAFPQITVPDPVQNGSRAIFPEVYMSVYSNQEVETVPPTSDIASSLLRDALVDTINILDFNRIATAKYLIDIDCYFTPHTFVKRATPFDRLRDISGDRPTWKPEDVAVDAVFSQLFQLPSPQHKLVYYHSVLTECCKIAPAAIAPSLGRAIRFLYRSLETIDLDLSHRFLDWFAHHLSNFGFTWKWSEWIDDLELCSVHPRMAFIIGALDKEIRLSFAQRIRGTLPDPYQDLITEGKEKDTPDFKYSLDTTPYANEGTEIMQLIRKKAADDEILPIISSIEEQARAMGVEDPMLPSTDAFVTAICFVGSKSLSHVLSCIERNKERLLAIGPKSTRARRQIITSVMEYWKDQPGIGINIIDKLLNYTILTPLSVIEWALVDKLEAGTILARTHVFEMISSTVGKVTNRLRQIVAARTQPGLYEPQLSVLDDTLNREKADMQALFKVIEDSIVSVAGGNNDELMERGDGSGELPEDEIIRQWGCRWLRAFRRKAGVEESFIAETMATATPIGTTAPPLQEGTTAMDGPADGDLDIADADGAADVS